MKKTILTLIAMAALSLGAGAQSIVVGDIKDVEPQGSYTPSFEVDGVDKAPLNVILMIGDGNGLAHIASGMYTNGGEMTLTNLKVFGLVTTQSADNYTTDSAASGTAYATGHKTYNSAVGIGVDHQPLANLTELLDKEGLVSGVVSTDDLDGATPASFFAHQPQRYMTDEIWADLPASKLSFFAAGSKEAMAERPAKTQKAINKVFTVVDDLNDPKAATADRLGYLPTEKETQSMLYGRGNFLTDATEYAIDFLSRKAHDGKGFFLMVEGARIDKNSHSNEYAAMVKEELDFDKAVTAAIKFAEKDGNTLVVISADHETGGLTLLTGDPAKGTTSGRFCTTSHTAIPVPLFAYGPSSHEFMGKQGNEEVSQKIYKLLTGK